MSKRRLRAGYSGSLCILLKLEVELLPGVQSQQSAHRYQASQGSTVRTCPKITPSPQKNNLSLVLFPKGSTQGQWAVYSDLSTSLTLTGTAPPHCQPRFLSPSPCCNSQQACFSISLPALIKKTNKKTT